MSNTFEDWYIKMFGVPCHNSGKISVPIWIKAIFAVHRDMVRKRPVEFYRMLRDDVAWGSEPIEAHFLERSWYSIFINT